MAFVNTGRKSGFIRRNGVMRRESSWLFLNASDTGLSAAATAALIGTLNAAALALRPFTVVRTRLNWLCRSDQSAGDEIYIGNIGMSVVSDQAAAVGVTAVPTPATDLGSDMFFLLDQWIGEFNLVGTSAYDSFASRPIDSKAMRKVNEGQDLAIAVEAGLIGAGVNLAVMGRILVKLH